MCRARMSRLGMWLVRISPAIGRPQTDFAPVGQTVPKQPPRETFRSEKARLFWAFAWVQIPSAPPNFLCKLGAFLALLPLEGATEGQTAPIRNRRSRFSRAPRRQPHHPRSSGGLWRRLSTERSRALDEERAAAEVKGSNSERHRSDGRMPV